jgi:hypothetical protein
VCTAYPQDVLSPERADAVIEARRAAAREMGRRKAAASRRARARTEPLTGQANVVDIAVVTRRSARVGSELATADARSTELLRALGLAGELNTPARNWDVAENRA